MAIRDIPYNVKFGLRVKKVNQYVTTHTLEVLIEIINILAEFHVCDIKLANRIFI